MKLKALLLSTAMVFVAPLTAHANLVANGDFETGNLSGWVSGGDFGASATGPLAGSFSARTGCSGAGCVVNTAGTLSGTAVLTQTMALSPGTYQYSYIFREGVVNPPRRFLATFDGVLIDNNLNGPGSLQSRDFVLAANGGATDIQFGAENTGTLTRFDSVVLTQIDDGEGANIGAASMAVALESARQFLGGLFGRFAAPGTGTADMASVLQETQVAGPGGASGSKYRAWISAHGSETDWDHSSTTSNSQGVVLGFEADVARDWTLGLAASVATLDYGTQTWFTTNRGYADEVMVAAYLQFHPESSPFYAMGAMGYGIDTSDVFRHSMLGSLGAFDVEATQWFGAFELGYNCMIAAQTTLTPFARVEGGTVEQDGYSESVLSGILLPAVVASAEADALRTLLGLRGSTGFNLFGARWRALAHVAWQHEFEQDRGVAFGTSGPFGMSYVGLSGAATPPEDAVAFGAGLDVEVTENVNLFAQYNGLSGDGQETHEGQVGVRVSW